MSIQQPCELKIANFQPLFTPQIAGADYNRNRDWLNCRLPQLSIDSEQKSWAEKKTGEFRPTPLIFFRVSCRQEIS
jgi:hypothetical protein